MCWMDHGKGDRRVYIKEPIPVTPSHGGCKVIETIAGR